MRDTLAVLGIGFFAEMVYRSLMYSGWNYENAVTSAGIIFVVGAFLFAIARTDGHLQ